LTKLGQHSRSGNLDRI